MVVVVVGGGGGWLVSSSKVCRWGELGGVLPMLLVVGRK